MSTAGLQVSPKYSVEVSSLLIIISIRIPNIYIIKHYDVEIMWIITILTLKAFLYIRSPNFSVHRVPPNENLL